jgi:SAM-dependent methyltransferase
MPPPYQLFAALSGAEPTSLSPTSEPTSAEHEQHTASLVELGRALMAAGYDWVCPSAQTLALVNGRFVNRKARNLAGVFGWNRPAEPDVLAHALPGPLLQALVETGVLQMSLDRETVRSRVRFSSFAGTLVAHSAWPIHDPEAVAFGPDTYRFGAFVERELGAPLASGWAHLSHGERSRTVVDLGCQSGAAGVLAARLLEPHTHSEDAGVRVLFTDTHPRTLRLATANARLAGLSRFACLQSETLADAPGAIDLVLAHPPYQLSFQPTGGPGGHERVDPAWGTDAAVRMVESALQRLAPGGRLLLCTGAPVVRGVDQLWQRLQTLLVQAGAQRHAVYRYQMLEPDVWGHLLTQPAYTEVERIAAVGLSVLIPHPR